MSAARTDPVPAALVHDLSAGFRAAMAEICSPVSVVTTAVDGLPHGTTVSAVCSLSMDPPMILISLDQGSRLLPAVLASRKLGINVLAAAQESVARVFASRDVDRFADVEWTWRDGVPHLPGAAAWVRAEVTDCVVGGDHLVLLARVLAADAAPVAPLAYHRRTFGTHRPLEAS